MVKTYANNEKDMKKGKCLFYPKAKACGVVAKPALDGVLMRPYVMEVNKRK